MSVVTETETFDNVQTEDVLMLTNGNTNEETIMPVDLGGVPAIVSPTVIQEAIAIKARLAELESNIQGIVNARETKKSPSERHENLEQGNR
ncbi:hypothetical protein FRX31_017535 [Thalictrum thalictroides]|uniref:Uncharacterized protein n=1 Tax=Thalictrum thalictroides TaxID=46969 RepID=A0A7J6W7I8_THATH|nr:hypothetical protein FRX31_017535 [Thalictrum thalictroides]